MVLDPITATAIITGLAVSIVSGAILAFLRRRWEIKDLKKTIKKEEEEKLSNELEKLKDSIEKNSKRLWRMGKTIVIMAKIIDDQTAKVHSELSSSLEDIAQELLSDSDD